MEETMTRYQPFDTGGPCRPSRSGRARGAAGIWAVCFCLAVAAQGATRYVDVDGTDSGDCADAESPCATISYAVSQAGGGDTVAIGAGTYTEPDGVQIEESLHLQGAGEAATILQAHAARGSATSRVLAVAGAWTVEIADMTIRHGVAGGGFPDGVGGGLAVSGGATLVLTDVGLRDNVADFGGGMASIDSSHTLTRVSFVGNSAVEGPAGGGTGGGMLTGGGTSQLIDVFFNGNDAEADGGGMVSSNNAPVLSNVAFVGNQAGAFGGGLHTIASSLEMTGGELTGNDAAWGGGAYNLLSSPVFTDVDFTDNTAGIAAGMYNNGGEVELVGVTFSGNVAALHAGGVGNQDNSLTLTGVTFSDNVAGTELSGRGGGMYNTSGSSVMLDDVLFTGNSADTGGGMHSLPGSSAELANVTFTGNTASGTGGGMLNAGDAGVFADVTFRQNTAGAGGGLANVDSSPSLTNVVFRENHAQNGGGGIYNGGASGGSPVLVQVDFIANTADQGGGMYNTLGSSPQLSQVELTGNVAEHGGGMYSGQSSAPVLVDVVFQGNATTGTNLLNSGGGMYNDNSAPVLEDVEFVDNESVASGGGMHDVNGSTSSLTNVTFSGNAAAPDAGRTGGGMSAASGSIPTLRNVTFVGNTAGGSGGGMRLAGGGGTLTNVAFLGNASTGSGGGGLDVDGIAPLLTNVTFSGNSASGNGGALRHDGGDSLVLVNSIVWGNSAGGGGDQIFIGGADSSVHLAYSLYRNAPGDIAGPGDFTAVSSLTGDPLFVDVDNGDFRLSEGSTAINAGDPETEPGLFPTDGEGEPVDLDGNPRFIGPGVDMGPYESPFVAPTEPDLVFDPASLDFGEVGLDTSSPPLTATLRNTGNAAATALSFDLAGDAFAADTSACGDSLAASAECEVTVTFTPQEIGEADGSLAVDSDEDVSALLDLTGTGVKVTLPPQIEVAPDHFAVTMTEGESVSDILTVGNLGEESLSWSLATAEQAGPSHGAGGVDCDAEPGLIHHDDGTIELGFPSILGIMLVDHFTPDSHPAPLSAVCLAFMTESATTLGFEIVVLADDGPGGEPGTELGALAFTAEDIPVFTPPPPPGFEPTWFRYDLSPLGLVIESGGVYVGVRWTQMEPSVYLPIDGSPPNPPGHAGGYVWNSFEEVWMPIETTLPDYRALFVRAVASACTDPVPVDWLEVEPAAGSTPPGGSSEVEVRFDAGGLEPGEHRALLCITSNDPSRPLLTVPVALTVEQDQTQPELAFEPPSLDFGEVEVGTSGPPQTVTLHNTGIAAATGLVFDGLPAAGFAADTGVCGTTLPAAASCEIVVTFTPVETGPAAASLEVASAEEATASLPLAGSGVGEPAFAATALTVDPAELASDGNGLFEPGEQVEVVPAWRNDGNVSASLSGAADDFDGPAGADYVLVGADAEYGLVAPGATATCEETGICYRMEVDDPPARPVSHWDAAFDETLSDGAVETWSLHLGDSFADVPRENPFYPAIETLLHHGVTGGCADTEYCPAGGNSRGQMAVFLLKAAEGEGHLPPSCVENEERFGDVAFDNTFCPWIEELAERGVTSGCGGGDYCPGAAVSRAQMAVFLLKALEGEGYTPPGCTDVFSDVECPSTFAAWIEELAARGITGGCAADPPAYCPATPVSRGQMAVFVTKTFGLALYGP